LEMAALLGLQGGWKSKLLGAHPREYFLVIQPSLYYSGRPTGTYLMM